MYNNNLKENTKIWCVVELSTIPEHVFVECTTAMSAKKTRSMDDVPMMSCSGLRCLFNLTLFSSVCIVCSALQTIKTAPCSQYYDSLQCRQYTNLMYPDIIKNSKE